MAKVLLTGSSGVIGTIIRNQVPEYDYALFDLPGKDATHYEQLREAMQGCSAVIHLAWDTTRENWLSGTIEPNNILATFNVYKAAQAVGVRRVVMASSIHANDLLRQKGPKPLSVQESPLPDSPYGASKLFMEALGRYFSTQGLETVCIRFMGLNANNQPNTPSEKDPYAKEKWFSHRDCGDLVRTILSAQEVPDNFVVMYGVSNNTNNPVDVSNPFGWMPKDNSSAHIVH
jgi:nucleoside-diphosphate-sugar epimerase